MARRIHVVMVNQIRLLTPYCSNRYCMFQQVHVEIFIFNLASIIINSASIISNSASIIFNSASIIFNSLLSARSKWRNENLTVACSLNLIRASGTNETSGSRRSEIPLLHLDPGLIILDLRSNYIRYEE